ncbi:hypothetical protein M885DRAFT_505536 [Pelagophyceae sp. CCMP2097]|nr:hypothetical protein M885DRAFT_505536 [Pelagophyceae sp. CCMP2097]|mmetsp:Transcript_16048/g.56070  ORF Transcript_16048/g.56070 Transcript_16048/m.56070 type:complete len:314 (-) Transcript_16048:33-974(-)
MAKAFLALCLVLGLVSALVPPGAHSSMRPRGRGSSLKAIGERGVAKLTGGAPKKQAKKQRRSRTPLLFPVVHEMSGRSGWLRLTPQTAHVAAAPNGTRINVVIREDDGATELVMSPRMPFPDSAPPPGAAPRGAMPGGVRLLADVAVGEAVEGTVEKVIQGEATVAVRNVFRVAKNGNRRMVRATLSDTQMKVGASCICYVRFAEPNSGKLSVSLAPVTPESLRRERALMRLKKQLKRGSLAIGSKRIGVIVAVNGALAEVHAGGLDGQIEMPEGAELEEGDKVSVTIVAIDKKNVGIARFEFESLVEDAEAE